MLNAIQQAFIFFSERSLLFGQSSVKAHYTHAYSKY